MGTTRGAIPVRPWDALFTQGHRAADTRNGPVARLGPGGLELTTGARAEYRPARLSPWIEEVPVVQFTRMRWLMALVLLACLGAVGCQSPYAADRGALIGGGTGAALGAIVGGATGNSPLAGAAIGGMAGAITGGAVGNAIDDAEARNRALIEAQLQRSVPPGQVTMGQVIDLAQAGVADELIVNHIRANGMTHPPGASDLIALQQAGVSSRVIAAMQEPPVDRRPPVVVRESPPPVIIEEHYYGRPYYYNVHPRYRYPPRRYGTSTHIGFSWRG